MRRLFRSAGLPGPASARATSAVPHGADPAVQAAEQGLSGRLTRGAGLAGIGYALSRALTFVTYLVLAQLITPSEVGMLTAGMVLVGMAFVFAESGMLAALIHWRGDIDEAASTVAVSSVATGLLLTMLGLATAPLVGLFFHSSTVGWVAAATSGLMLLRSLQIVPDALLQRRFAFVRRVAIDPLGALVHGVVSISCCAAGLGVWGLVLGNYALYLSQAIAGWGLLRWWPRRHLVSFATWRALASYARHVVASEVVRRTTSQIDAILLGRFSGTAALGQYGYGLRIAAVPTDAWVSIASYALLPAFARIADDLDRFRHAFVEALGVMCTVGIPVALLLLVVGDKVAFFLFGPKWPQSGDAIQALSGVGLGQMLTSISSETFKAAGLPQLLTRTHLLTAATSVVLLPALLVGFQNDVVGIAIGVSSVSLLTGVYAIDKATDIVGVPLGGVLRGLLGLAAAGLVGLAAVWALDASVLPATSDRMGAALESIAEGLVMAVVYTAAVRLLAPAHFARIGAALGQMRRRGDASVGGG